MKRTRKSPEKRQQAAVDRWNTLFEVGTSINYHKDDGSVIATKTRSEAQMLSGHTAVIWLEGVSGCVALERVTFRTEEAECRSAQ